MRNGWTHALAAVALTTLGCDRVGDAGAPAGRAQAQPDPATAATRHAPDSERSGREGPRAEDAPPTPRASGVHAFSTRVPGPSSHPIPASQPAGVVHVPDGVSERPWLTVFLHGWRGCAAALVASDPQPCVEGEPAEPGWGLADAHDGAGLDSVLVVPQLAWMARDGSAGRFEEPGFAASFLARAVDAAAARAGLAAGWARDAPIVLAAHSAGYETAHWMLERGDLGGRVRAVVLFDALYAREDDFGAWLAADPATRRLLSWYASDRSPYRNGRKLLDRLRRRLGPERVARHRRGPLGPLLRDHVYVLAFAPDRHADVPRRRLAESLSALVHVAGGPARRGSVSPPN